MCLLGVDLPFRTGWKKHVSLVNAIAEGIKCLSALPETALYDFASSDTRLQGSRPSSAVRHEQAAPSSSDFSQTWFFLTTFRSWSPLATSRVAAGSGAGLWQGWVLACQQFLYSSCRTCCYGIRGFWYDPTAATTLQLPSFSRNISGRSQLCSVSAWLCIWWGGIRVGGRLWSPSKRHAPHIQPHAVAGNCLAGVTGPWDGMEES